MVDPDALKKMGHVVSQNDVEVAVHHPLPERSIPMVPLVPPARNLIAAIPTGALARPVKQVGTQLLPARVGRAPWRRLLVIGGVVEFEEPALEQKTRSCNAGRAPVP